MSFLVSAGSLGSGDADDEATDSAFVSAAVVAAVAVAGGAGLSSAAAELELLEVDSEAHENFATGAGCGGGSAGGVCTQGNIICICSKRVYEVGREENMELKVKEEMWGLGQGYG